MLIGQTCPASSSQGESASSKVCDWLSVDVRQVEKNCNIPSHGLPLYDAMFHFANSICYKRNSKLYIYIMNIAV